MRDISHVLLFVIFAGVTPSICYFRFSFSMIYHICQRFSLDLFISENIVYK